MPTKTQGETTENRISDERIIGEVAKDNNAQADDLWWRKTKHKDFEAMELSYRHSNFKQKKIPAIFGVDCSTVSQSRSRLKTKI